MTMDKTVPDLATAVLGIESGMTLMIGGFGGSGAPIELIHALIDRFRATGSPGNLTVINNNAGNGRIGIAAMIDAGMVAKMICSFPRSADPRAFTEKYLAGQIELELVPQGTLAERIRAGGAGIPAFYTPTSYGTELAEGQAGRRVRRPALCAGALAEGRCRADQGRAGRPPGQSHLPQGGAQFLAADGHGRRADRSSRRRGSSRPAGSIPNIVVTPGIFVDRIVEVADPQQEEALMRAGVAYA